MNEKVLAAIAETLPETQVKMIKDALVERDRLRGRVEELEAITDRNEKDYNQLSTSRRTLQEQYDKLLAEHEITVATNLDLAAKDIQNRVTVAEAKLEAVNGTVDRFLKNSIIRESYQHQVVNEGQTIQTHYDGRGGNIPVPTTYKNHQPVTDVRETERT